MRLHDITAAKSRPADLLFIGIDDPCKICGKGRDASHHDCVVLAVPGTANWDNGWFCECDCTDSPLATTTSHYFVGEETDDGYICEYCLTGRCPR